MIHGGVAFSPTSDGRWAVTVARAGHTVDVDRSTGDATATTLDGGVGSVMDPARQRMRDGAVAIVRDSLDLDGGGAVASGGAVAGAAVESLSAP